MSSSFPTVVVLAGGLGTRLGAVAQTCPKNMMTVAGEPFVAHQMRLLKREGVSRVVFCLGHLAEQVMDFVGDGSKFHLSVDYCLDGPKLLGTGGAIKRALREKVQEKEFSVLYGDSYLDIPLAPIAEKFVVSKRLGLMTVLENGDQWDTSNVLYRDGEIVTYDKKLRSPEMRHIDYGLSIFSRAAFDVYGADDAFDLSVVLQRLIAQHDLAVFEVGTRFYEIGTPESLAEAERYISARLQA